MIEFNYGAEIVSKNGCFYPIHLSNEQLNFVLGCIIHKITNHDVVKAYVRKAQIKGVEFRIDCGTNINLSDIKNLDRQYSVLISPNWSIQIIDNWFSLGKMQRCQVLINPQNELNKTIHDELLLNINKEEEIVQNPILMNEDWCSIRTISDETFLKEY